MLWEIIDDLLIAPDNHKFLVISFWYIKDYQSYELMLFQLLLERLLELVLHVKLFKIFSFMKISL